jgi:hypothetical protein
MDTQHIEQLQDGTAVAWQLNCEIKTLEAWRSRGEGPVFVKIGRLVRYAPADVLAWIESRRVKSTSEAVK